MRTAWLLAAVLLVVAPGARADDVEAPMTLVRVRAAAGAPGTVAERAQRVCDLGRDGLTLLASDVRLGKLADEVLYPALQSLPEQERADLLTSWVGDDGAIFAQALRRFPSGVAARPPLAEPLSRFLGAWAGDQAVSLRASGLLDGLVERDGAAVFGVLIRSREVGDSAARAAAATALGRSSRVDVVTVLEGLAQEGDAQVAAAAALALGGAVDGTDGPADDLALLLRSETTPLPVRRAAAIALGRLRASRGTEALVGALESSDAGLRRAAHAALVRLSGRMLEPDPALWQKLLDEETARTERDLPVILTEVETGEPALVFRALRQAIGFFLARDRVRASVTPLLEAPAAQVRVAACAALAQLGDLAARPALSRALGDREPAVAQAAARAYRQLSGAEPPAR